MNAYVIAITILVFVFLVGWVIENVRFNRNMTQNQKAWDEYSKNLTRDERWQAYNSWCKEQRARNNWNCYYFPDIDNMPYTVFKCRINGKTYRGTKKEISAQSGVPIGIFDLGVPSELNSRWEEFVNGARG